MAILAKFFGRDLVLACLAGAVLVVAYLTISRAILALEFTQNFFERIP